MAVESARFTDPEHTQGIIVRDSRDNSGPIPSNAGDIQSELESWLADGGEIEPYVEPPPVPVDISVSDRQFAQALAEPDGGFATITWEEATEWGARGVIPAILMAAIDQIPDDLDRQRAIMFVSSAKEYELLHPAAVVLGQLMGWDEDRRRALWEFARTL